jgi:Holliday junction resolvase
MAVQRIKSPYRKGYLKELEVMRILKNSGKFQVVFRSAASHSPFDVVAISKSKVLLLQVKTGKFNFKEELEKLKAI